MPAKLHDDLIVRPEAAATRAREDADEVRRRLKIAETVREAYPDLLFAHLRLTASIADTELTRRESARELRAGQFEVMRNTVFETDRAVQTSIQRLQLMNVSAEKIRHFQERAAEASTPEQVAHLEAEAVR